MSINLSWFGVISETNLLVRQLSEADRKFLLPKDMLSGASLPGILLVVRIGRVTERSIPHIVLRLGLVEGSAYVAALEEWCGCYLAVYLSRFIGVSVNIATETNVHFMRGLARQLPKLVAGDVARLIKTDGEAAATVGRALPRGIKFGKP